MSGITRLVAEASAPCSDSRKRRESSKQQQHQRQQLDPSDESVPRPNQFVLWALSSCVVVTVAALGLLVAPLIARNYYQTEEPPVTSFIDDTDDEEIDRAPIVLDAPGFIALERRFAVTSRPGRPSGTARAEVVPPPKGTIYCVLEVALAARLAAESAPCRFCSHVVLCCAAVDPSWLEVDGMSLETTAASLRKHHPHVRRVLGIGDASSANETALASAIDDSRSRTRLVDNIVRTMKKRGLDGGSLIRVMHPEHLKEFEKFVEFVSALCLLAAEVPVRTAVFLPSKGDAEAKLYEAVYSLKVSRYVTLIKLTHADNLEQYPPGPLPCPTPESFFDARKTEKALRRFEQADSNATGPMFLVTLSAAVLEFGGSAEGDAKVSFQRVVGRGHLCDERSWSMRRSNGCVVASADTTFRVGHDPQSDWGAWRRAHGVVVFDINLDDTWGKCGPPYSFTRSVYFALETHAGK